MTDDPEGPLSRLADRIEAEQLDAGREVLALSRGLLDDPDASRIELRFVARRLSECLGDAVRIAESRGGRARS
ncbi:MAG: hypothetical protein LBV60_04275 [Streptomyces sp.]|nr:hypothetical protein [Streptomyces sp.]